MAACRLRGIAAGCGGDAAGCAFSWRGGLCFWMNYRVGLGQVRPTPTADKKKSTISVTPP